MQPHQMVLYFTAVGLANWGIISSAMFGNILVDIVEHGRLSRLLPIGRRMSMPSDSDTNITADDILSRGCWISRCPEAMEIYIIKSCWLVPSYPVAFTPARRISRCRRASVIMVGGHGLGRHYIIPMGSICRCRMMQPHPMLYFAAAD